MFENSDLYEVNAVEAKKITIQNQHGSYILYVRREEIEEMIEHRLAVGGRTREELEKYYADGVFDAKDTATWAYVLTKSLRYSESDRKFVCRDLVGVTVVIETVRVTDTSLLDPFLKEDYGVN